MRDPHWLAGTTSRSVTGGLLVTVLLVIEAVMSCKDNIRRKSWVRILLRRESVEDI